MSEVLERPAPAPDAGDARASAKSQATALVRAWVGRRGSLGALVDRAGGVDQVGVNERVDA